MKLKKILYVFASLFIALLFIQSCMTFRTSDKKFTTKFDKQNIGLEIKYLEIEGVQCRYIKSFQKSKTDKPLIIFIHGAPGSSSAFTEYMMDSAILSKANTISVDRLGYGYSDFGKSETSIKKQAEFIHQIILKEGNKNVMAVGHSYGGPIAARISMDYPNDLKSIVMLAPAIDPDIEKLFWYAYFGKWKATRWMISKPFCVSADEKFSHAQELELMRPFWSKLKTPTLHIHGNKDGLVSYKNLVFTKNNMSDTVLTTKTIDKAGHLLIMKNFEETKLDIIKFFDNTVK